MGFGCCFGLAVGRRNGRKGEGGSIARGRFCCVVFFFYLVTAMSLPLFLICFIVAALLCVCQPDGWMGERTAVAKVGFFLLSSSSYQSINQMLFIWFILGLSSCLLGCLGVGHMGEG